MPKTLVLIFLLFITSHLKAQSWEVGGFAGGAGYMGDLNPTNPLKISGAAVGGLVKYNFNGYLSAKLNYTFGTIRGADSTSSSQQFRDRNLSFVTKLNELSLIGEFNFMKYIPSVSSNVYTPFIYIGVGVTGYNPQATYKGQTYDLRPLQTEGQSKPYGKTAFSIPYGVGIKYNFTGAWNIIADIGYRNPNTDYLDDVSGYYPAKSNLTSPLSVALSDRSGEKTSIYTGTTGSQRGDLRPRDTYLFIGFTISYTFITPKCYY
ncbi:MAG: outer rane beta-barrel protein [Mucilaginibacter sp.]|nr:outer rane beta-barrel protein [Mucilaginibacter sp.]